LFLEQQLVLEEMVQEVLEVQAVVAAVVRLVPFVMMVRGTVVLAAAVVVKVVQEDLEALEAEVHLPCI
jgi:hypothetical protein